MKDAIEHIVASNSSGKLHLDAHIETTTLHSRTALIYRVVPTRTSLRDDFFEARFVYVAADLLQIDVIDAHRPDLRGRGGAPSVLFHLARHQNARVRSSSNMNAAWVLPHEVRVPPRASRSHSGAFVPHCMTVLRGVLRQP